MLRPWRAVVSSPSKAGKGSGNPPRSGRLVARLEAAGHGVVTATREPGGSPGAEAIRDLVLRGDADRWSAVTETLLMYAARRDHIERVIRPALARGDLGGLRPLRRFHHGPIRARRAEASTPELIGGHGASYVLEDDPARPDPGVRHGPGTWPGPRGRIRAGCGDALRIEGRGLSRPPAAAPSWRSRRSEPERCVVIDANGTPDQVATSVWETDRGADRWLRTPPHPRDVFRPPGP